MDCLELLFLNVLAQLADHGEGSWVMGNVFIFLLQAKPFSDSGGGGTPGSDF